MIVLLCVVLMTLVSLLSAAMLFRPVRVLVARVMPIDPDNFVHKIALSFLTLVTLGSFLPLIVLGGQPPLLLLINAPAAEGALGQSLDIAVRPQDLVYQFIWTIPATFVAAGWPVARRFKAVLERLGFVRPTLLQVVGAVVGGVALAVVAAFGLDPAINQLWRSMGWGVTDLEAFGDLMSQLLTLEGALLIGVTAGVGEELAVRGLLQPRIGLIASNLVFTSLHAFQYGVDALLSVFIIGIVLGLIRMRTNTTTSAIVHGVYDFVLVLASTSIFTGQ
jgi:membrane protease YdiL (CAAX protease family)